MADKINPDTFDAKREIGRPGTARGTATAPGQAKLHTYTRKNPATGITETGQFPQSEDKLRKDEGWVRLEDITGDSVGEVENPVPTRTGVAGPLSASERAPAKADGSKE